MPREEKLSTEDMVIQAKELSKLIHQGQMDEEGRRGPSAGAYQRGGYTAAIW